MPRQREMSRIQQRNKPLLLYRSASPTSFWASSSVSSSGVTTFPIRTTVDVGAASASPPAPPISPKLHSASTSNHVLWGVTGPSYCCVALRCVFLVVPPPPCRRDEAWQDKGWVRGGTGRQGGRQGEEAGRWKRNCERTAFARDDVTSAAAATGTRLVLYMRKCGLSLSILLSTIHRRIKKAKRKSSAAIFLRFPISLPDHIA